MNLEASALQWLRYTRRCALVCLEREPFSESSIYRPDVLGITQRWTAIEIEVKRTYADFRANGKKRGLQVRNWTPSQFFFLVPPDLIVDVESELPNGAGLLTVDSTWVDGYCGLNQIVIKRRATSNKEATRVSKWQVARMVMHQSSTLVRMAAAISRTK